MLLDEIIDFRRKARFNKDYKLSDQYRAILETELIFIFDSKDGPDEIHYLTEKYFKHMHKTKCKTKREYLEYRMRLDREADDKMKAWIYTYRNN